MASLAQITDIPGSDAYSLDQQVSAQAALDNASAAVRAYCRRDFDLKQRTTRIRAKGDYLLLPERPVVSVDLVKILVYGQPTATTGYVWDGLDRVWIGALGIVINLSEELTQAQQFGVIVADVTYTAGFETVPADVTTVVAGIAARAMAIPAGGVINNQSAGPFSYTISAWAQGGPLSLSDSDKAILNRYRRMGSAVELRSS